MNLSYYVFNESYLTGIDVDEDSGSLELTLDAYIGIDHPGAMALASVGDDDEGFEKFYRRLIITFSGCTILDWGVFRAESATLPPSGVKMSDLGVYDPEAADHNEYAFSLAAFQAQLLLPGIPGNCDLVLSGGDRLCRVCAGTMDLLFAFRSLFLTETE